MAIAIIAPAERRKIRERLQQHQLTQRAFCRQIGLHERVFSQALGGHPTTTATIAKIEAGLRSLPPYVSLDLG